MAHRLRSMRLLSVFLIMMTNSAAAGSGNGDDDFAALKDELVNKYDEEHGWTKSNFTASLGHPINQSNVQQSLDTVADSANRLRRKRLAELTASLRPLFNALPKAADGTLSYQASRYAVHRFMMRERGWYIRGLESSSAASVDNEGIDSEWATGYLHGLILQRSGSVGTSLSDLALFVAALEDLISFDAKKRLRAIYEYLGFEADAVQAKADVQCILDAYMFYMLSFDNLAEQAGKDPFTLPGNASVEERRSRLCDGNLLTDLPDDPQLKNSRNAVMNALGDERHDKLSFSQAAGFAYEFISSYHNIQQKECNKLKGILVSAEDKSNTDHVGCIGFDSFHRLDELGDFKFQETETQLRRAGVLDGSSEVPYVVLANYIGSRINCVESSGLFAICCQNECDAILSQLELQLESPRASASQIMAAVAKLPSTTSLALPELSPDLLRRLESLEKAQEGYLRIHSDGFARWMHLAYPRECPQARAEGSSTIPMTASEWLRDDSDGEAWDEESPAQPSGTSPGSKMDTVKKIVLLTMAAILAIISCFLQALFFQDFRGKLGITSISATSRSCRLLSALTIFAAFTDCLQLGQLLAIFIAAGVVRYVLYRVRIGAATNAKIDVFSLNKPEKAI